MMRISCGSWLDLEGDSCYYMFCTIPYLRKYFPSSLYNKEYRHYFAAVYVARFHTFAESMLGFKCMRVN